MNHTGTIDDTDLELSQCYQHHQGVDESTGRQAGSKGVKMADHILAQTQELEALQAIYGEVSHEWG